MRCDTVAMVGGAGFIGSCVANRLTAQGRIVRIATRRRAHALHLLVLPVDVVECDVRDPRQLEAFVAGADAVINLVGVLHGSRGKPYGAEFAQAHVELPRAIVHACRARGVRRLLHVSALGADANGPSMYLRSKGDGERVVRDADDLMTTIFRPSVVFGEGDNFLNLFARLQRWFPILPLACPRAAFQPIHVGDVAQAMVNVLDLLPAAGKCYELGGPRVHTLEQLVRFVGLVIDHPRPIMRLPDSLGRLQAALMEHLPGAPLTRDALDSMKIDSVLSGPLDPDLGIHPGSVEVIAPRYLRRGGARAF